MDDNLIVLGLIIAAFLLLLLGQYLKSKREERQAALQAAGDGDRHLPVRQRASRPRQDEREAARVQRSHVVAPAAQGATRAQLAPQPSRSAQSPAKVSPDEECRLRTRHALSQLPAPGEVQVFSAEELESLARLDQAPIPLIFRARAGRCEPVWKNFLVQGQHWAVSGTSQFGKSSWVRALAYLLLFRGPESVEVWAADPKVANFGFLRRLKHGRLYADLFTDEKQTVVDQAVVDGSLVQGYREISREMTRRYGLFLSAGVDNLEEYNAAHPEARLPFIVFLAEEAHDLAKEARELHERIVKMGGGAGIIVVTSTQHPANVISTQIRMNTSCYVAFNVADGNNYVEAALGLAQGQTPSFTPAEVRERGIIVYRDRVLGKEAVGRVMHVPAEHRRHLVDRLVELYGREQSVKPLQDDQWAGDRGPGAVLLQELASQPALAGASDAGKSAENAAESADPALEISAPSEAVSQAAESGFRLSESDNENFQYGIPDELLAEATAYMAALILRGRNQTETLTKDCPGYSGRRHDAYKTLYQQLRLALTKQGVMVDRPKPEERAESAIAA